MNLKQATAGKEDNESLLKKIFWLSVLMFFTGFLIDLTSTTIASNTVNNFAQREYSRSWVNFLAQGEFPASLLISHSLLLLYVAFAYFTYFKWDLTKQTKMAGYAFTLAIFVLIFTSSFHIFGAMTWCECFRFSQLNLLSVFFFFYKFENSNFYA